MPALNKREYALKKSKAKSAPGYSSKSTASGSKFPSKPDSRDGKFEGVIGSKSKMKSL